MFREHERVVLTVDLPDYGFQVGDVGTVVYIYENASAYELEFFALNGQTLEVVTVEANQIRPVSSAEVLHARSIAS